MNINGPMPINNDIQNVNNIIVEFHPYNEQNNEAINRNSRRIHVYVTPYQSNSLQVIMIMMGAIMWGVCGSTDCVPGTLQAGRALCGVGLFFLFLSYVLGRRSNTAVLPS